MLYLVRTVGNIGVKMNDNNDKAVGKSSKISDDTLDGIAALTLIAVAVTGVVFWLSGMPY